MNSGVFCLMIALAVGRKGKASAQKHAWSSNGNIGCELGICTCPDKNDNTLSRRSSVALIFPDLHTHRYTHTHIHTETRTHTHTYAHTHIHTHTHTLARMSGSTNAASTPPDAAPQINIGSTERKYHVCGMSCGIHTHTHRHTYAHTHIHTYTHTAHTQIH